MAQPTVPMFAHTFLVTNNNGNPTLEVVAPDDSSLRKKRPHRKSRLGCIRCKRRKVKCDENTPCANCVKRNEACVRAPPPPIPSGMSTPGSSDQSSPPGTATLPREMDWSPLQAAEPETLPVNLLHMELLHHFERVTIPTLMMKEIWGGMLQLAFRSQQHTFLVNAMLSLAAAHLSYLLPSDTRYHRAKHALLSHALRDYRTALSAPITPQNCDPLLGGAILVHYLLWCDLSFLDNLTTTTPNTPLDLSGDRLYWLSTGQRQIFFMAWPLFQQQDSIFMKVGILQPCMALSDEVEARGLNWRRFAKVFDAVYDNVRFWGGRDGVSSAAGSEGGAAGSEEGMDGVERERSGGERSMSDVFDPGDVGWVGEPPSGPPLRVSVLFESYKEADAFVRSGCVANEDLTRAAYKRLAGRLAIAMAFVEDARSRGRTATEWFQKDPVSGFSTSTFSQEDIVRYVLTFPMLCFGPLLPLISSGDSRMLLLLYHIYHVVDELLPDDQAWWCRKRVAVMKVAIKDELKARGLEICLKINLEGAW